MKKTSLAVRFYALLIIAVIIAVALPAPAQQGLYPRFKSVDFLGASVKSLVVSNLISATNYTIPGVLGGTNVTGVTYTNKYNVRIVTSATSGTNTPLFTTVRLWSRADGSPLIGQFGSTNYWATSSQAAGDVNVSVSGIASAGADTAMTFILAPAWDGTNIDNTGSFDFTFAYTPTASTTFNIHTNLPMGKWNGAGGFAVKSVTFADTTAGATVALTALRLNGFGPP